MKKLVICVCAGWVVYAGWSLIYNDDIHCLEGTVCPKTGLYKPCSVDKFCWLR